MDLRPLEQGFSPVHQDGGDSMRVGKWRLIASCCGGASLLIALGLIASFVLGISRQQSLPSAGVVLGLLSFPLLEIGSPGTWLPRYAPPKNMLRGALRFLTGIASLLLLLLSAGGCIAGFSAGWDVTTVEMVFGYFGSSLLLSHLAVGGKWFP
jgi:hypothetical protein